MSLQSPACQGHAGLFTDCRTAIHFPMSKGTHEKADSTELGVWPYCLQIFAAPLPHSGPWGRLLHFSEPQFSYLKNENNNNNGKNSK